MDDILLMKKVNHFFGGYRLAFIFKTNQGRNRTISGEQEKKGIQCHTSNGLA
jgi:hypothetical protein